MSEGNPYTPPKSDALPVAAVEPNGFSVDGEFLILQEGANLPKVCVGTGTIEGELSRFERPIHLIPPQIHLLFFPLMLIAWRVNFPVLTMLIVIGWVFALSRLQRKMIVGFSIKRSFLRKQILILVGAGVVVLATIAWILGFPLSFEVKVMVIYAFLIYGTKIATVASRGIKIKDMNDGVARLMNVNPVTLAKLGQWDGSDRDGE